MHSWDTLGLLWRGGDRKLRAGGEPELVYLFGFLYRAPSRPVLLVLRA